MTNFLGFWRACACFKSSEPVPLPALPDAATGLAVDFFGFRGSIWLCCGFGLVKSKSVVCLTLDLVTIASVRFFFFLSNDERMHVSGTFSCGLLSHSHKGKQIYTRLREKRMSASFTCSSAKRSLLRDANWILNKRSGVLGPERNSRILDDDAFVFV